MGLYHASIYLHVLLVAVSTYGQSTTAKQVRQCTFVGEITFDNCGTRENELKGFRSSRLNRVYDDVSLSKNQCKNNGLCRKMFNIARIRRQSFSAKTLVHISEMIRRCCGNCTKYHLTDIFTPIYNLNQTVLDRFDIVYPVPAQSSLNEIYGRYFIPVYNIPDAYYVTMRKPAKEMAMDIVKGCLMMWPILAACLLMSLIAGFIAWIMDTWSNEAEFPRPFIKGLFQGFWWSFVSMTTVGYGDKSPKSLAARCFAVIWILMGITLTSIYVASLTTKIMSFQEEVKPELKGMNVGALKNRLHDAMLIAQHGGTLKEIEFNNTVHGVVSLIQKMEKKEIDGFLVSKSTYFYFSRLIRDVAKYRDYAASVSHVKMVLTEKSFLDVKLVTGMVVKNLYDYEYFKKYFESNWLQIQGCYQYDLNYKEKRFVDDTPNAIAGLFLPFLGISLSILGIICIFGIPYEIRRRKKEALKKKNGLTTKEMEMAE